jgi:hypothetical protein
MFFAMKRQTAENLFQTRPKLSDLDEAQPERIIDAGSEQKDDQKKSLHETAGGVHEPGKKISDQIGCVVEKIEHDKSPHFLKERNE